MNSSGHASLVELFLTIFMLWLVLRQQRLASHIQLRPIPGLEKIRYAVARAAENGKTISFSTGITSLGSVFYGCMALLHSIVQKAARLRVPVLVPQNTPEALAFVEATMRDAYLSVGMASQYSPSQIRFLSEEQFAFAAGYSGMIHRENVGTAFLFGSFAGESLLLAEAGKQVGAYQIAGCVSPEQVPFFICSCDYTLIGEEFFAASAYLSDDADTKASLRVQDIVRVIVVIILLVGSATITVKEFF